MKQVSYSVGTGKYKVALAVTFTGDGLVGQLYGGEKPHVGAVVMTMPRASLADPEQIGTNSTVVPRLGHKEDELAKPLAEFLAKAFNQPVVLVLGLHIDRATPADIQKLVDNCWQVTRDLVAMF